MPHLPVMEGYILLGGVGSVLIGASLAEKFGIPVNSSAIKIVLGAIAIGGIIIGMISSSFLSNVLHGF